MVCSAAWTGGVKHNPNAHNNTTIIPTPPLCIFFIVHYPFVLFPKNGFGYCCDSVVDVVPRTIVISLPWRADGGLIIMGVALPPAGAADDTSRAFDPAISRTVTPSLATML